MIGWPPTGFLNGKFGSDQMIIASNSTAVIPTIRNASAATSWSSQCLYTRMKIVPPLKNERGMNALKTQQSLNLLLQAGHTRTRSEFITLCCHPLVKVYLDLVKVYLEWRLSWPVCFMKCCCISALLHSLRASFSQQRR
jgi:hypothetical protein